MTDQNIQTIAIVDPRSLDGNPYEVAEQAAAQAAALVRLSTQQTVAATKMGRNAASERSLVLTGEVPVETYDQTAEGKAFVAVLEALDLAGRKLAALVAAVGFDPKARVPKGK